MNESQRKAKNKYKAKIKRLFIELYPTDADLLEHLQQQDSVQGYIKKLIRDDINRNK